jgi:hypothetical protein
MYGTTVFFNDYGPPSPSPVSRFPAIVTALRSAL